MSLFAVCTADASAVTFNVNLTQDLVDAVPGDGVCSTDAALDPQHFSLCSLRAAVMEGNATALEKDVHIVLVPGALYKLTIAGADESAARKGDLDILRRMHIGVPAGSASKARVDANRLDRAFELSGGAGTELFGIEIFNGFRSNKYGAAISSFGSATLSWLDVHDNSVGYEDGFSSAIEGNFTIRNSRVHHNGSQNHIVQGVANASGAITVVGTTIDSNSGPGINVQSGSLWLHSSTISNNYFGIYSINSSGVIYNSTISGNSTSQTGNELYFLSGGEGNYSLAVVGSIIDGSDGMACNLTSYAQSIISFESAWNIYSDGSCLSDVFFDHSLHNATINLSELGDWGGPTPTMVPLVGSDAIDFAPESVCNQLDTDQRGLPRPVSASGAPMPRCDIGAVEVQPAVQDSPSEGPIFGDGFESL